MLGRPLLVLASVTILAACTGAESASDEASTRVAVDSVALAAEAFDAAAFDTVSWETTQAAIERGGVVFTYSCSKCHGARGFGDGGFVQNGETLHPPSFHQASWEFAGDLPALRAKIFTGAEGGMPHWGLAGLKVRDIDAVSRYILQGLRGGA